jgi:ComF family protein
MHYRGLAQRAVRDFKYHGALWLQGEFAGWLEALWNTCPEDVRLATAIVPVPMHARRLRTRGYNQARLIAEGLSRRVGVPCRARWLKRVRATPTQTRLTARGRAENVRGCFAVGRWAPLKGARVVLVDDVMTTGATLGECAKTLKRAGAAWVAALTVARGG